jgi:hypothetical protein
MKEGKYGKYIIQELQTPSSFSPEFNSAYAEYAHRILWMDNAVVDGAFQMNTSWYLNPPKRDIVENFPHVHEFDELIGFYGSDPENPYDLGGLIEFSIMGEKHDLTRSSLIFVPAGVEHLPLNIVRVDRPIFHFSISMSGEYTMRHNNPLPEDVIKGGNILP